MIKVYRLNMSIVLMLMSWHCKFLPIFIIVLWLWKRMSLFLENAKKQEILVCFKELFRRK